MEPTALLILADGFEEIEAITTIDILRRADVKVTLASLNTEIVTGAHGIRISTSKILTTADTEYDALILPGGMPGSQNLADSEIVTQLIKEMDNSKKIIAAICAAPSLVLAPKGLLNNKKATCYAGMETNFPEAVSYTDEKVVQDQNIITSRGPATAPDFAFKILEALHKGDNANALRKGMLYNQ